MTEKFLQFVDFAEEFLDSSSDDSEDEFLIFEAMNKARIPKTKCYVELVVRQFEDVQVKCSHSKMFIVIELM